MTDEKQECLCGKEMIKLGEIDFFKDTQLNMNLPGLTMNIWVCPPDGCGRLYTGGGGGTWYLPEKNDDRTGLTRGH